MFHKNKKPMTDLQAAEQLLMQRRSYGTFGLFWGPEPFALIKDLGLLAVIEIEPGNPNTEKVCISLIRIYNYAGFSGNEIYEITPDGKILDHDGKAKDPKKMLSLKRVEAQAGWEIHDLLPDYGEKVEAWINAQKDSS